MGAKPLYPVWRRSAVASATQTTICDADALQVRRVGVHVDAIRGVLTNAFTAT